MIYGGDGNDLLSDGLGNDTLYGGAGDDFFANTGGSDTFDGGEGKDTLFDDLTEPMLEEFGWEPNWFTVGIDLTQGRHGYFDVEQSTSNNNEKN